MGEKTHSEAMEEAGRPTLKSILIYFLPTTPMNPSPPMWLVGLVPALLAFFSYAPGPWTRYLLLGPAAGDPALDGRPAWLQALDSGERVVLIAIHLFIATFHLTMSTHFKSEIGQKMVGDARALVFTDAPRGSCDQDAFQWPPGPYMARPVLYMRLHSLIDASPLVLFALGLPDLAFMAMLVEKAGGMVDHLYMYGGTFAERLSTMYPILFALGLRLPLLLLYRAAPAPYGWGGSVARDAAAHVAGALLVAVGIRPLLWVLGGSRPCARGHPGRKHLVTAWKKKA